jgi:tetratricopeptide (TPR) repeat protein
MYKRGKGSAKRQFKAGFRRSEMANWQGAIDIWKEIAKSRKRKNAGRACLNIAVAYEVLGNTDKALEWIKKSYEDYNNKLGRDYAKVLIRRKNLE